ncbi:MAG: ABC transporter ATP-binding protein [Firmicutes bacterium]|nr:ABC transporter ATP-binding protein [Bacillota bacterium]
MRVLARLFKAYAKHQWHLYVVTLFLIGVEVVLNVYLPQLSRAIVDTVVESTSDLSFVRSYLFSQSLLYLVWGLIRSVVVFVEIYLFEKTAETVSLKIRRDLYDHVQRLDFSFHNKARTGDLMSRVTSDVQAMRELAGFGIVQLVYCLLMILLVVGWMVYCNPSYALACLMSMPLLLVAAVRYSARSGPVFRAIQDQIASMTAKVQESVSGIRVVKAFAQEDHERAQFGKENDGILAKNLQAAKINAFYHPAMDFLASLGGVGVIWYGGRLYMSGALTAGDITAFLSYLWMLIWPVRSMGWVIGMFQRGIAGSQRVFEVLDERRRISDSRGSTPLQRITGRVHFDDVTFSYDSGEKVLDHFTLEIEPGETIGVLGMTGSGKSTVGALIPRFYDADSGTILVDGVDVRNAELKSLRSHVGIVPQDTFLFSASIRENIAYHDPNMDLERVIEAAKAAQIHDFVETLPQRYETVVGERGIGLSGGQRQRVAIARAIATDPKILILDDSTASVDAETESAIQESLREIAKGRTTIIISQKVSSVRYADRIVVLKDGRIVELGTHEELMARDGFYSRLHAAQTGSDLSSIEASGEGMVV